VYREHYRLMLAWSRPGRTAQVSSGAGTWCLLLARFVDPVLRLESRVTPALGPLMAFRLLLVIEKRWR